MERYNSQQSDFDIPAGNTAIIGFQQVLSNPEKVFVWTRGQVDRPKHTDRHKTAKQMNNSFQKVDWAKSVWLIDKVLEHFGQLLKTHGITRKHFENLSNDELADKWETRNDGDRNFLKAILMNPVSEVSGEPLAIQVTQVAGTIPKDLIERSSVEADGDVNEYDKLLKKYLGRAMVRTYVDTVTYREGIPRVAKELVEVYVEDEDDNIYPVYETNEITLGEPAHVFIEYKKPVLLPKQTFAEIYGKRSTPETDAFDLSLHLSDEGEGKDDYKIDEEDVATATEKNDALKS